MHCINFGGNLLTKRSFYVKQAILTIKKDQITRGDKELACYEECSRFCWKIWWWGKNLTSKRTKKKNKKELKA